MIFPPYESYGSDGRAFSLNYAHYVITDSKIIAQSPSTMIDEACAKM